MISKIITIFSITSFFITIIIPINLNYKVYSHIVSYDEWIFVDGEYILKTNPIESNLMFENTEHFFDKNFEINREYEFYVDLKTIKGFEVSDLQVKWILGDKESINNPVRYTFDKPATKILKVLVLYTKTNEILTDDSITLKIGEQPKAESININSVDYTNKTYFTENKESILNLSVTPEEGYKYDWSISNKELAQNKTKIDLELKNYFFPLYIVVRKTNISTGSFTDSFTKISTDSTGNSNIPKPSNLNNKLQNEEKKNYFIAVLVISSLTLGIVFLVWYLLKKKKIRN